MRVFHAYPVEQAKQVSICIYTFGCSEYDGLTTIAISALQKLQLQIFFLITGFIAAEYAIFGEARLTTVIDHNETHVFEVHES